MEYKEITAKTVYEAITQACLDLGVSSDRLDYEVLSEGSKGFLGIGSKPAVIRYRKLEDENTEEIRPARKEGKKAVNKESSEEKSERPERSNRSEKSGKSETSERKFEKEDRFDKGGRSEDRSEAEDKFDKGGRSEDRSEAEDESDKSGNSENKSETEDKSDKGGKSEKSERSDRSRKDRRDKKDNRDRKKDRPKKDKQQPSEKKEPAKPVKQEEPVIRTEEEIALIKEAAETFLGNVFAAMQLPVEIKSEYVPESNCLEMELSGADMGMLIGKRGQTLDSLQYLTSLAVNRKVKEYVRIKIDTEDYRRRRKETLENLAKNIASKVKKTRKPVVLEPMNPYERRIIHSALQPNQYVETYSEGNEPYRHVVVVPKK